MAGLPIRSTSVLAVCLIPVLATESPCQEPVVGERVRVEVSTQGPALVGLVQARGPGSLVIESDGSLLTTVSWADITRLEVSRGMKSRAWLGAGIGAGAGVLASGIWWSASNEEDDSSFFNAYAVAAGAVGGALIGFAIGSAIKVDRWEDLPADRWRIEVAPDPRGGVAIGLNLRL